MATLPDIEVTATGVSIDGDSLGFDEVVSVGYLKKVMKGSGVTTDIFRRFELEGPGGRRLSVKLDGAKVLREEKEDNWRELVETSQQSIEPRLRAQALERIQSLGEPVTIGRLELARAGFTWKGRLGAKQYTWAQYHRAYYVSCQIRVLTQPKGDKEQKVGALDTDVANAVLLPQLMPACAQAFSAGD